MSLRRTVTAGASVALAGVMLAACGGSSTTPAPATMTPTAAPATPAPTEAATQAATEAPSAAPAAIMNRATIDPATLPKTFPFKNTANQVLVDASIAGQPATTYMFDTGAPTSITPELAAAASLPKLFDLTLTGAGDKSINTPIVDAGDVSFGGLTFGGNHASVNWQADGPFACVTQSGLIGANTMANAVWQIDYQAKTITAAPSVAGLDHVEGAIPLLILPSPETNLSPTPVTVLAVGNDLLPILVDTGSNAGLSVSPAILEALGVTATDATPRVKVTSGGAAGSFDADVPYITTAIKWPDPTNPVKIAPGDTTFDYPIAANAISAGYGNMGNGFLKNFVVTFDFPNSLMYLDPVAEDGSIELPKITSAGVTWNGTDIVVGNVAAGGPADKAGLKIGQKVTAINGKPVSGQADACAIAAGTEPITEITTEDGKTWDAAPIADFLK